MKFGVFYEHQIPRPWHKDSEYEHFQNALTQIELADKCGYDYAWQVEHHFLEEYSHGSSPTAFLAAASQRTKSIRLGHGVMQLTTNRMDLVRWLAAARNAVGEEPWEYSSKKWCSTCQA